MTSSSVARSKLIIWTAQMLAQTARSVWSINLLSTRKITHKNQYRLHLCHGNIPCNVCLNHGSRECWNVSSDKLPTEITYYLPSFFSPFGGRKFWTTSDLNLYAHIYISLIWTAFFKSVDSKVITGHADKCQMNLKRFSLKYSCLFLGHVDDSTFGVVPTTKTPKL